jgi:hypothetical protein
MKATYRKKSQLVQSVGQRWLPARPFGETGVVPCACPLRVRSGYTCEIGASACGWWRGTAPDRRWVLCGYPDSAG